MDNLTAKLKRFYSDLIKVSRLTKTKNKKLKIFLLGIAVNAIVFFDIIIIFYFSSFFSYEILISNPIIEFFIERKYFLPIFIFLRFLCIYFEKLIATKLQFEIENNLRVHLINEVFKRGNISTSDAFYYLNALCAQVGNFYALLAALVGSLIQIVVFTTYLLLTNFETVLVFSLGSLLLVIPTIYLTKLGRKYAHITYNEGIAISSNTEKIIDNLFLIKILKKVNYEVNKFQSSLNKYYASRINDIKVGTVNAVMPNFFTLFLLSILLIFFNFGKILTLDFIGILLRLFQSLGSFNKNIHAVSSFHVYLEKLYEIEQNKELVISENFKLSEFTDENIAASFKNVDFRYLGSEDSLFKELNIDLYRNKHTIITGFNGSGKSTLLGLVSGIFYPTSGTVEVYSNKFGYVSASPMIINGTLRENLTYGSDVDIEDSELLEYLLEFQLFKNAEEITLDKKINNKSLSMGQMQKVSFIRSLVSGVDILILDESTSNLDKETKDLIYEILSGKDLTIFNSTHSPEEFKDFDFHIEITEVNGLRNIEYQ